MSLTDWIAHPLDNVTRYTDLGAMCLKDVGRFDDCDKVWGVLGIGLGAIAILVLFFIARHFVREYAAHRRFRRTKLAEMEIAPSEIMNEHVWSADRALETGLTQEQMIQKIKEAKARQRAEADRLMGTTTTGSGNSQAGKG